MTTATKAKAKPKPKAPPAPAPRPKPRPKHDPQAELASVASSGMLVDFSAGTWRAIRLDKDTSSKVAADNNARKEAVKTSKYLLAGNDGLLKSIANHLMALRVMHVYPRTSAWFDGGTRYVPTGLVPELTELITQGEADYWRLVNAFLDDYPNLVSKAAFELGSLFNHADYPSVDVIREKFYFHWAFAPVPQSGHFLLNLEKDLQDTLRDHYEKYAQQKIEAANRELWDRMYKRLEHISERMTVDHDDPKSKRLHDSVINNALEDCKLLEHLNVMKDPKLEQLRAGLYKTLINVDPDDLRKDLVARTEIKSRVDALLEKFRI